MIKLILLFSSYLLLFVACHQPQTFSRDHSTCKIDLREMDSPSFFDYFSKIEIIPLETSDSSLIKRLSIKDYHQGDYYILDEPQKKILIFDDKGKYLREINKRGNGPGEYSDLTDFSFNPFTKGLDLLNPMGGILRYDSLGQNFVEKISLPLTVSAIHEFTALDANTYLFFCRSRDGNKMVVYDIRKKTIISEMYDLPEFLFFNTPYHHSFSPFYIYNEQVHFVQAYNGDVFTIENNSLVPKYSWDFGEQNFDILELEDKPIEYYLKYTRSIGSRHANIFIGFGENTRYYMTRFCYDNKAVCGVYDKVSKQFFAFNTFKEGHRWLPNIVDEDANYCITHAADIDFAVNVEALDDVNRKICEGLTDDSNPVIIKYIFKK